MKMKVMICQPMAGKTEEEIFEERCKAVEFLDSLGFDVANTLFEFDAEELKRSGVKHIPLYYLSESLKAMSKCDSVYYCEGWENARGCVIEHAAASAYGVSSIMWGGEAYDH
jgi:hypothetical protein